MAGVILGAKNTSLKTNHIAFEDSPTSVATKTKIHSATKRKTASVPVKNEPIKVTKKKERPKLQVHINKESKRGGFLNKNRKGYTVLLSSFKMAENAENYAKKVSKKGYDAFYFSKEIQGKTWHRVAVGSFTNKSTAESLKKQLIESRLGKGFVVSQIPSSQEI